MHVTVEPIVQYATLGVLDLSDLVLSHTYSLQPS